MRAKLSQMMISSIMRWRSGVYPRWRARVATWREPHEILFFYDANDAYSHLVALCLPRLRRAYDVPVQAYIVSAPSADMAPARKYLDGWALRDVRDIAPFYGLRALEASLPARRLQSLALRALAGAGNQLVEKLPDISKELWHGQQARLQARPLGKQHMVKAMLQDGDAQRARRGHYLGGVLYYRSTWYWGIDRLPYLLERLQPYKRARAPKVFPRMPADSYKTWPKPKSKSARALRLECFLSLRSPYSYLAMRDLQHLAKRYGVEIVTRPVLPMVMRGLPVPRRKGFYILEDAAREARRHAIAFGKIADPVGEPVRRGMSLFPYADSQGLGLAWMHAFCTMAWSEGYDMAHTKNLQRAAQRIGMDWASASQQLDSDSWQSIAEANQSALFACKLWGVPSFHLRQRSGKTLYTGWGRDRIWRLAYILAGHRGA